MMTDADLDAWFLRLNIPPSARARIAAVRASPPSRRVRGGAGNVCVRYSSRKMGVSIQAESHKNELALIHELEHDPNTLEYYDQPPPIPLRYMSNGRRRSHLHTSDIFAIETSAAGWYECKMEADLVALSAKNPDRYCKDSAGRWIAPPGESYAAQFGLFYRVRSSAEISWVFQRNIEFLKDFFDDTVPTVPDDVLQAVRQVVDGTPGITLKALLADTGVSPDFVYTLLASGGIYADLHAAPFSEPERVHVFRHPTVARAYSLLLASADCAPPAGLVNIELNSRLLWSGRPLTIVNPGVTDISLRDDAHNIVNLTREEFHALLAQGQITGLPGATPDPAAELRLARMNEASPEDFDAALLRYNAIAPDLFGIPSSSPASMPPRTRRHWIARFKRYALACNAGFIGLLSSRAAKGNRQAKLPEATLAIMNQSIQDVYETPKQQNKVAAYGTFLKACDEAGTPPASYKTYATAVKRRPQYDQVLKRRGSKAAYQKQHPYLELALTTPRHGERPLHIVHIDHTLLDIVLVHSVTRRALERPWLTIMTDAFSRRFLAVYLSFDAPSYRSCMMIFRELVRRHHRFPQVVVVDGGPEFNSNYFELLLTRYGCDKKQRPPAQARFGSVCERLFGTTNTRFIDNLLGNTQITKNVRQVTKRVAPAAHAVWTLPALFERLREWAHEVYDTTDHPALGQTPREAFNAGTELAGARQHMFVSYDEEFRTWTLPSTPRQRAKVQRDGIKIHNLYYWSDVFRTVGVQGTSIPVRYDPSDASVAFAHIDGHWHKCHSQYFSRFANRSEREIQIATEELRRQSSLHQRLLPIRARDLADFLASTDNEELQLQRLRDSEVQRVSALIDGARTDGLPAPTNSPQIDPSSRRPAPTENPMPLEPGPPTEYDTYQDPK